MKAMILAAGYGTRLRPVTYTLPKPMVPVCNRPLIAYAVEALRDAGVTELVVNLHHLPDAIEQFLRDRYGLKLRVSFSFEPEILGTGGGVRKVRPLLETEDEFFLVNADTIQFPRWESLRDERRQPNALAALTVRHPPQGDKFTPVWVEGGRITGFGDGTGEPLMFSGSHCISSRIFRYLPDKDFSGIVDGVYMPVLADGREKIAGFVDDGLWFDIGTPQRYMGASRGILEQMVSGAIAPPEGSAARGTSIVHDTARIAGAIESSAVGDGSVIEGSLRHSFVWDNCRIAAGATIESCIVAHGVEITRANHYRNAIICRDDPAIPRDAGCSFEDGLAIAAI
ncbi:MAG: sugar phosphate nucleotidyltransferase [Thermoanaerobaculia bacterium]